MPSGGASSSVGSVGAAGSSGDRSDTQPSRGAFYRIPPLRAIWPTWHAMLGMPVAGLLFGIFSWATAQAQSIASGEGGSGGAGTLPWYGLVMGYHIMSLLFGLPMLYFVLRSSPVLRSFSTWIGDGGTQIGSQIQQMLLGQAIATISLPTASIPGAVPGTVQTSQIVFQQGGSGNRVDLLSTLLGDVFQETQNQYDEAPPWRDLQCLQRQLAQLLGRTSQTTRPLMPAQMPYGEVQAFLTQLHSATSQLGVGISEMADVYSSSAEVPMQQVLQFASTLDMAAHTFRGLAAAMRGDEAPPSGIGSPDAGARPTDAATEAVEPGEDSSMPRSPSAPADSSGSTQGASLPASAQGPEG